MNVITTRSALKQITGSYVGHSNVEKFALWAFGKKIDGNFHLNEMKYLWNERHPDIFYVREGVESFDCYLAMINIWKENFSEDYKWMN